MINQQALIRKYNVPGPRYTSFPTVPYWDTNSFSSKKWKQSVFEAFQKTNEEGMAIYIHLPFCESLCTYCGCNTRITVNHKVEDPYITAVLKEWQLYLDIFKSAPAIKEIHLGGGTPTFFSPENLKFLINGLLQNCTISENAEFSFEGHPNNTTEVHLQTLFDLGFRRVSFGIQDFDPKVQKIINRIQTFEQVEKVVSQARKIGYTSINFDLIYGLPLQTNKSVIETIEKVKLLRPDRIAFYSYAHVPWIKPGQRKFTEVDLPADEVKRQLYETGKQMFSEEGYHEIGMDHFALPSDSLFKAMTDKNLHRNFMGYTHQSTKMMIGLGVSSISDTWNAFAQNVKKVEEYYSILEKGELPVFKGHFHSPEDLVLREHILDIMCRFNTSWNEAEKQFSFVDQTREILKEIASDDLIIMEENAIWLKDEARPFVRNICMAFDSYLLRNAPSTTIFSSTV